MNEPGAPSGPPCATYRVQFSKSFGFSRAREIVPYLAELGISHIYASPLLMARPGSTHGYDIVDHSRLNPEYGEEAAFDALVAALHAHRMGLILDFVPNHMGVGPDNPWWVDVLEWGRASPYAAYFDIDWQQQDRAMQGKVLLPVLGDQYGAVLERGELRLSLEDGAGTFVVTYFDQRFPISPRHYPWLLERVVAGETQAREALAPLIGAFRACLKGARGKAHRAARRAQVKALKDQLAEMTAKHAAVRRAIDDMIGALNGRAGESASFNALHRLLESQAYRLAFWRVAVYEINYRRFFDINDLAGLRMEQPDLFAAAHRRVRQLIAEGKVQGLRLDHVDGLRAPKEYFQRLQRMADPAWQADGGREAGGREPPLYVVVEKVLAGHEGLRRDWPVSGTTGYEFMAAVNGLFIDPASKRTMTRVYRNFSGNTASFADTLRAAKHFVMREILAAERNVLANIFYRLAKQSRRTRDYTRGGFREALDDVIAYFPVYRTYVSSKEVTAQDRRDIEWAVGRARKAARTPDKSVYDFIRDTLTLDLTAAGGHAYRRQSVIDAALRFQQYTGPVMAKAEEDTAYYRYLRLVALNEVGADPTRFGTLPAAFHEQNRERQKYHPHAMLTSATHDHKRGEDVRARLAVLSEIPGEWSARVRRWARFNARKKQRIDDEEAPGTNEEYLLYQTLAGTWPYTLGPPHFAGLDAFRTRIRDYMLKAAREAKDRTSWAAPDDAYESALNQFVDRVLNCDYNQPFLDDMHDFAMRIAPAGAANALAQTLLKLTCPGVPDFYQGAENWDFSLVDPDNRHAVDFAARRRDLETARDARPATDGWQDGRLKQRLIRDVLAVRRNRPELFATGGYRELASSGPRAANLVAFARTAKDGAAIIAVPRLVFLMMRGDGRLLTHGWDDTGIALDDETARFGRMHDALSDQVCTPGPNGMLAAAELFAAFPVALFLSHERQ